MGPTDSAFGPIIRAGQAPRSQDWGVGVSGDFVVSFMWSRLVDPLEIRLVQRNDLSGIRVDVLMSYRHSE